MKLLILTLYSLIAFTLIYWSFWYALAWLVIRFPSYSILAMIYITAGTAVLGTIIWGAVKLGEVLMIWI